MAKPHIKLKAVPTRDSFQNFIARVGSGAGSVADGSNYTLNPITRNRVLLENSYRGSWLAGMVVDAVAEDMTREGVELTGNIKPEHIEELQEAERTLQIWSGLCDTIKWGRLYGGSAGVMMIDGQDTATPLRVDRIEKGQFKGILALDRWLLQPNIGPNELIKELGPNIGTPEYYTVVHDSVGMKQQRIHHSRVIRMEGIRLPYWQRITENYWGESVLERLWDRMVAFDSTTAGTAQLVYKAYLRTYKVEKLRELIASGGPVLDAFMQQIDMIRRLQTNEGLTVIDTEDEMEMSQYTFSGLSDVLLQFGQQLSGAAQIPLVRLFGQSPAGMNSTGESDLRTYYDNIKRKQETDLRPKIRTIYELLYRSTFGSELPKGVGVNFRSLWQMPDDRRAEVGNTTTAAVLGAFEKRLISQQLALKELRQQSRLTGLWTNISDKDINAADDEIAPSPDELELAGDDAGSGSGKDEPGTAADKGD